MAGLFYSCGSSLSQDLEGLALHKDQRCSHALQQLQARDSELERLRREVDAQAEARKVQLETATQQRYANVLLVCC